MCELLTTKARMEAAKAVRWSMSFRDFNSPIFILSPPRSGSTFLFECLARHEDLTSLPNEADGIWWKVFPYSSTGWSDHVPPDLATPDRVRRLRGDLYFSALANTSTTGLTRWFRRLGLGHIRYLDKTIANCFHLDVLASAFKDPRFVLLVRDPRPTISSMIEGWPYLSRFGKPQLTPRLREIDARTVEHWTYPAPPGWEDIVTRPLAQICAWSWGQHITHTLDGLRRYGWTAHQIRYEDLIDDAPDVLERLMFALNLKLSPHVLRAATEAKASGTTVSSPRPEKWRAWHGGVMEVVADEVREIAAQIGYELP